MVIRVKLGNLGEMLPRLQCVAGVWAAVVRRWGRGARAALTAGDTPGFLLTQKNNVNVNCFYFLKFKKIILKLPFTFNNILC